MPIQPIQPHHEDYMFLMKGVTELDLLGQSVPCDLVLTGDHAFPLAMNSQGQVLMAASLYGHGRIVVLGHEVYLTAFPTVVENALTWLRGDGSDNVSVGIHRNVSAAADNLSKSSFQTEVVEAFSDNLGIGVYVTDAYSVGQDLKDLVAFLKAGGGVLIAGQAWSWAEAHPKENILLNFPGNKVSGVAGIYFSGNYGKVENLPVYPEVPLSWMALKLGKDFQDDLELLLEGVSEFDMKNETGSEILVHGLLAFPIGTTKDGRAFLAGAYYGQGRVVVISHEAYLGRETLAPVWNNAIRWLDEGRNGVVGVVPKLGRAFNLLKSGFKCEKTEFRNDLSVFVCTAYDDKHVQEIQDFVAEGGGLLIGGHAWWWAATHREQNPMTDFSGNKILNKMGLSLLNSKIKEGSCRAPVPSQATKDNYHFCCLLRRIASHVNEGEALTKFEEEHLKNLDSGCVNYLSMKADDWYSYILVVSTLINMLKSGMPQVFNSCPVYVSVLLPLFGYGVWKLSHGNWTSFLFGYNVSLLIQIASSVLGKLVNENNPIKNPVDHLLLRLGTEVYKVCPDPDALLPYFIKDNPLMPVVYNQRIRISANTAARQWISTGLYLTPGMKTQITIPAEIINKKWMVHKLNKYIQIQIGCHTDLLCAKELKRAPCVHKQFPITSEMMQVWNLWGGLIYLVAPPNTQVNGVEVIVQMAVSAPYYKSGETTAADWSLLRTAPAPWAELEFENIILTVPSEGIRGLDRPDELAAHWDAIMRSIADLAAIPHKFPRKERIVIDVQISRGWMHSGYPIMGHKPTAAELVSTDIARSKGLWGPIHELGHNQQLAVFTDNRQRSCWEFPPHTTECTCNLWSVYVHEEVLGINRAEAHPYMTLPKRKKRTEEYAKGGRKLHTWSTWVALETYMQLQEQFGWDAFKKVFAAYHGMSNFPKDNNGKMNLYAETFSQTVGMNLCGFFKSWGWPIDPSTEKKLSNLPPWTNHPMVQYD